MHRTREMLPLQTEQLMSRFDKELKKYFQRVICLLKLNSTCGKKGVDNSWIDKLGITIVIKRKREKIISNNNAGSEMKQNNCNFIICSRKDQNNNWIQKIKNNK